MAINPKLREQARVLEQKESWREAINLYRQVLEEAQGEETDIGLWNRIGDLHLRLNETEQAVEAYESAIAAYSDVGLHNNAIALCRKVLRITPHRPAIYRRLGQIYAAKGFLADARQNFLEYAERTKRAGKLDESFEALKEFADLSPTDTDLRRLLAEQLHSHGRTDEGVEQLRILLGQAVDQGDEAGAEALRAQIRGWDPNGSTEPIHRAASRGGAGDDFHFDDVSLAAGAPSAPALGAEIAADLSLPEPDVAPVAGLETTSLESAPPGRSPVPEVEHEAGLEGFEITHVEVVPTEAETAAPSGSDLPFIDLDGPAADADEDDGRADAAPLPGFDPGGGFGFPDDAPDAEEETDDDGYDAEPLPMMDLDEGLPMLAPDQAYGRETDLVPPPAAPAPTPAPDPLEEARARFRAAPEDPSARGSLLALLDDLGCGAEAAPLLEEAHRGLAARGRYADALEVVGDLVRRNPLDVAYLQKQVEYAFRGGIREPLVSAYLALGRRLVETGEEQKGRAVFQRVLEIEPANAEAREAAHPGSAARAAAPPAPSTPAPAAPADDYIDLGALIMEDEPAEATTRFVVEEKEPTGDEDRDFAEMLSTFRQKVAENIDVEDAASHYDLGMAFKEMGLIDEAISELQVALRGGANPLATLELIGQCFVEKGQYEVASRVLDRALRIPDTAEGDLIGVLYQLGRCQEALHHPAEAREYYSRVLAMDIRFRDAQRRVEMLRGAG